jgi:cytochrome oxidase Cu insertion factor (SCO1/SenC/PrrC family)
MQNNQNITGQTSELEMQRRGRKVVLLMLIFFIVPIAVVIMMYKLDWKPNGESLGELVKPARLLDSTSEFKNNEGSVLSATFWKEKWSVVYIAGDCQKACLDKLHEMRQLHVSLYKDIERAQRVLITSTQDVASIKRDYPDMIIINQPIENIAKLSQQFQVNNEDVSTSNRLYLVDPLGHLMMSYQPSIPLANVRKDLSRLLRFSWAG